MEDLDGLLGDAREGSAAAFTAIYEQLVRPVAGYLRSRGVRDVEDVTSEVFLAVFTGIGRFRGDWEGFRAWVFTIAHRRSVDYHRKTSRTPATSELIADDDAGRVASAEELALDRLGEREVLALLETLSVDQREVLMLRVVGDLTIEQVAQVVGKRPGAVKALQHRGLARLRRAIPIWQPVSEEA